jgi:hypothetical protein
MCVGMSYDCMYVHMWVGMNYESMYVHMFMYECMHVHVCRYESMYVCISSAIYTDGISIVVISTIAFISILYLFMRKLIN